MTRLISIEFMPPSKIISLLILLLLLVSVVYIGILLTERLPKDEYPEMKIAAERMQAVRNKIHGIDDEKNGRKTEQIHGFQKGFIGTEFSPITTSLGNLDAKRSALNPDFAALIVTWLRQCGVNEGDRIAIQASASFPALTLAAIIACETLNLKPVISVSLGASSYGANVPAFTYLDMEKIVFETGDISNTSGLVTPGGTGDNGSSMWPGAKEILTGAVKRTGKTLYIPETLYESIKKKWDFFNEAEHSRIFINIGGNHTSLGIGRCALRIPSGLITELLHCGQPESEDGLIHKFNHSGIPVIHLLNIRDLAIRNGLSLIPPRIHRTGESDVYFTSKKPLWFYIISLLIALLWGIFLKK